MSTPNPLNTPPSASSTSGRRRLGLALLVLVWGSVGLYHACTPLPPGVRTAGPWHEVPAPALRFLRDLTSADAYGRAGR